MHVRHLFILLAAIALLALAWFLFTDAFQDPSHPDALNGLELESGGEGAGFSPRASGEPRAARVSRQDEGRATGPDASEVEGTGPALLVVEAGTDRVVPGVSVRLSARHPLRERLQGWHLQRAEASRSPLPYDELFGPAAPGSRERRATSDAQGRIVLTANDRGLWLSVDDPHWFAVAFPRARASRRVDRLEVERGARLRGVVVGAAPRDAAARLVLVPTFGSNRIGQSTSRGLVGSVALELGRQRVFEIGGLPAGEGTYRLFVQVDGFGTTQRDVTLEPGADHDVRVEVPAGVALVGRVESARGGPVAHAAVALTPNVHEMRLGSRGFGSPFTAGAPTGLEPDPLAFTTTASDGTFEFRGVGNGSFALTVTADGYAPAKLPRWLVREGSYPPIVVTLAPARTVLGLAVRTDGTPVPGAVVTVEKTQERSGGWGPPPPRTLADLEAIADTQGRFAFATLPRDEALRLNARSEGLRGTLELPLLDPEVADEPVEEPVQLVMKPRGNVLLHLVWPEGSEPSREVRAAVVQDRFPRVIASVHVAAPAVERVVIEDVPTGRHRVLVNAAGFAPSVMAFERKDLAETVELRCVLQPGQVLRGRAIEEGSGLPVVGARIEVAWDFRRMMEPDALTTSLTEPVRSGAGGEFVFRDLPGEEIALIGIHPDFPEVRTDPVQLPREDGAEVVLTFQRGGTLRGTVTDAQGTPRAQLQVMVERLEREGFRSPSMATTDERGAYSLHRLEPGAYRATVIDRSRERATSSATRNATVRSGQVTVLDFAERAEERATLLGRITASDAPLAAGMARLFVGAVARRAPIENGAFRFEDVPLGHHRLIVDPAGLEQGWGGVEFPVLIDKPGDVERAFRLPSGRVRGFVRDPEGKPASAWVRLLRVGPGSDSHDVGARTTNVDDGSFAFDFVAPGTYRLIASVTGNRRVRTTGAPTAQSVVVRDGEAVEGVVLALAWPGSVLVRVLDERGEPVADARVRLFGRDRNTEGLVSEGRADRVGLARVRQLAPGRWGVLGIASGCGAAVGQDVLVVAGEELETEVRLPQGHEVQFEIRDEEGEPVPDATISLVDANGVEVAAFPQFEQRFAPRAQLDGSYTLGRVAPGSYRTIIRRPRNGASVTLDLAIAGDVRRQVVLDGR